MQNLFNINTLTALQPSIAAPVNSQPSLIDNAGPEQKFDVILNERLNEITNRTKPNSSDENHENNIAQHGIEEVGLKSENENREYSDSSLDSRINNFSENNDKENIKNINKDEAGNQDKNIKNSKDVHEAEEENNLITKERKSVVDDLSLLLDNLNLLLDIIKNTPLDKKQTLELKSVLSELSNTIDLKNIQPDKTHKNDFVSMDGALLKKLLERLKSLVDTANERVGIRNQILGKSQIKDENLTENKSESLEMTNLKKQIAKLADEIRQHLTNKKSEINSAKSEDTFIESKNINQKILAENQNIDKSESAQGKENTSGFNFSSSRKESETAGVLQQKGNAGLAERKSVFDEQLNTIVQNARIVVKDSKNGSFSIRLHPESLGRVNVNLNLEQGVIVGKFLVDSFDAKEALLENMSAVKENLLENGISVGEFQVNVRDENKSFSETSEEIPFNHPSRIFPGFAGIEYEANSLYLHNGEIDLII